MDKDQEKKEVTIDLLKKYGARWAVLAAFQLNLNEKGVLVPKDAMMELTAAQVKIASGCFSACEVGDTLGKVEAELVSRAAQLGDEYVNEWLELLSQAMIGTLDRKSISEIPLLKPIESDCAFLDCACGW